MPKFSGAAGRARAAWVRNVVNFLGAKNGVRPDFYAPGAAGDGGVCRRTGVKYKAVWPVVVDICKQLKCTPEAYVDEFFLCLDLSDPLPHVKHLVSDGFVSHLKRRLQLAPTERAYSLKAQTNAFYDAVVHASTFYDSEEAAAKAVLLDTAAPLSALFRHCIADRMGYSQVAAAWAPSAAAQYARSPEAYDSAWGTVLTAQVRASAVEGVR